MTVFAILSMIFNLSKCSGNAVYYAESWNWDQIAMNQGIKVHSRFVPIAVPDCGCLGQTGLLWLADAPRPLRVVVADCAHPDHRADIEARGIVAEIPYPEAEAVPGMIRNGSTTARLWLWSVKAPAPRLRLERVR